MARPVQPPEPPHHGVVFPKHNGTTITHISAAHHKSPFESVGIPVTMHELSHGLEPSGLTPSPRRSDLPFTSTGVSFSGQFGIIDFDTSIRLPRHVHISEQHFTTERILVLNGVALVELNGEIYIIPPRTLVTIAPGVPHTWTACPPGLELSGDERTGADPLISNGTFLMVYEYEEVTGFFPTEQTQTLQSFADYRPCDDLHRIRFPSMSAEDVRKVGWFVWGNSVWKGDDHGKCV